MKILRKTALALFLAAAAVLSASCGAKAPEKIELTAKAVIINGENETYDLSGALQITGDKNAKLRYESSDPAVASVSENGVITARSFGSAVISVIAEGDESIRDSADILVYPYIGVYAAEKYIDAMGCDIRVRISLAPDGTYDYYRYPMVVTISGGGAMPSLADKGTYKQQNGEIAFTGEILGDFSLSFKLDENRLSLSGSVPTGGAKTQLQMPLYSGSDRGEAGVYKGTGETPSGDPLEYELRLDKGEYAMQVKNGDTTETVSSGRYVFSGDNVEFVASQGVPFTADYSAGKGAIEGMDIPYSAADEALVASVTLTR